MSSYSREQLENWLKKISLPSGSKVLDVGGSQNPVINRIKDWSGLNCEDVVLDLETPHECKRTPQIIWDLNQDNDPSLPDVYKDKFEYFDIAFCLEVSEYWYNPIAAMQNIWWFLKQNGILYISFHFVYPVHNPVDQDYLRYTPNGVRKLLEETGFEILEETPRLFEEAAHLGLYTIERMRPAKGYQEHAYQGLLVKAKKVW